MAQPSVFSLAVLKQKGDFTYIEQVHFVILFFPKCKNWEILYKVQYLAEQVLVAGGLADQATPKSTSTP